MPKPLVPAAPAKPIEPDALKQFLRQNLGAPVHQELMQAIALQPATQSDKQSTLASHLLGAPRPGVSLQAEAKSVGLAPTTFQRKALHLAAAVYLARSQIRRIP